MSLAELMYDHTYRTVLLGTVTVGAVCGALGCFVYLRRQSLVGDVIAHSSLPGMLLAFWAAVALLGVDGRTTVGLLVGAALSGCAAVAFMNRLIRERVARDAAMVVTITIFFGAGLLLLQVIARGPYPGKGGIQDYLLGNASLLTTQDVVFSAIMGAVGLATVVLLWKQFSARTFDPQHASAAGYAGAALDGMLFAVVVLATVLGVKAVGIVLTVAFVVTPPATARQWTRTLGSTVVLAAGIAAAASAAGSFVSYVVDGLPTGPVIVLVLFALFLVSALVAPGRGALSRARARRRRLTALRAAASGVGT